MCNGTLGTIDTGGKYKWLDGLRVRITLISQTNFGIEVVKTYKAFSRGDSFLIPRGYFLVDSR